MRSRASMRARLLIAASFIICCCCCTTGRADDGLYSSTLQTAQAALQVAVLTVAEDPPPVTTTNVEPTFCPIVATQCPPTLTQCSATGGRSKPAMDLLLHPVGDGSGQQVAGERCRRLDSAAMNPAPEDPEMVDRELLQAGEFGLERTHLRRQRRAGNG